MRNKAILFTATGLFAGVSLSGQKQPNIVFLMAEDLSREDFEIYTGHGAQTPNLERLASHGIIFDNAYSSAPVSSAARSTLITGCYAPSLGLSWHRKLSEVTLPEGMHLFPYYLRKAGYYTANCSKTDYNCKMQDDAWDNPKGKIGEWRKRPDPKQPFFECITDNTCHESSLFFPESDINSATTFHDPWDVILYPMHPDTPLMRYTYARHYDAIRKVDNTLGKIISMLEEDGVLDNTFIFYMGDNGGCLPGTKAYTLDLGLRVPMVVYVPDKWLDLSAVPNGTVTKSVVSFMDLAPTLLNLAGMPIPAYMDGKPFFGGGSDINSMNTTVCYGDRFDELYACNRVVRWQNYTYSRNFYPYHPKYLHGYYRVKQAAFRQWIDMYEAGELNEEQSRFFKPQGAEELYLITEDTFQENNLVDQALFSRILANARKILDDKMISETDLGIIPEALWVDKTDDIEKFKSSIRYDYPKYLDAANAVRKPYRKASRTVEMSMTSRDEILQYWGLVSCNTFGKEAESLTWLIGRLLKNGTPMVRSKAAVYCTRFCGLDPNPVLNECIQDSRNEAELLSVLNDAAYIVSECPDVTLRLESNERFAGSYQKQRLNYINFGE